MTGKVTNFGNGHFEKLLPLETQWMDVIPVKYRAGALKAFQEFKDETKIVGAHARNKAHLAYMDAFVTCLYMTGNGIEGKEDEKEDDEKETQSDEGTQGSPECLS